MNEHVISKKEQSETKNDSENTADQPTIGRWGGFMLAVAAGAIIYGVKKLLGSRNAVSYSEVCVEVSVKPQHVEEFIQATRENQRASRLEPANVKFDIFQSIHDRTRFILHEVFQSPDGAAHHKTTSHYLQWKRTVEDWMATPRKTHEGSATLHSKSSSYQRL